MRQTIIKDKVTKASVGCHYLTEKVDEGKVIVENFKEVEGKTEIEVYNELYPVYIKTLIDYLEHKN